MKTIVRFAPSPTGYLHVGNIRLALINWLYSKTNDGQFILRFDDTDTSRSETRYVEAIKNDLLFLKIEWDKEAKQSDQIKQFHGPFPHPTAFMARDGCSRAIARNQI